MQGSCSVTHCFTAIVLRWSGGGTASHLQPYWPVRHADSVCACGCAYCCHTNGSHRALSGKFSFHCLHFRNGLPKKHSVMAESIFKTLLRWEEQSSRWCSPTRPSIGPVTSPLPSSCSLLSTCLSFSLQISLESLESLVGSSTPGKITKSKAQKAFSFCGWLLTKNNHRILFFSKYSAKWLFSFTIVDFLFSKLWSFTFIIISPSSGTTKSATV